MISLSTTRLSLRPFIPSDAAFLVGLMHEDGFVRHIGDRGVRDEATAHGYMETGPWAMMRTHGFSLLCVVDRADGRPVGMCGLLQRPWLDRPDLGFAITERVAGRGYAREASRAVLHHWVGPEGIREVCAIASIANDASHRVLHAVGFVRRPDRRHPDSGEPMAYFEYPA